MRKKNLNDKLLEKSQLHLFPDGRFEQYFKEGECLDSYFIKRDYKIRLAMLKDLSTFMEIEKQCWASELQTSEIEIQRRISDPACLVFILEYKEEVIGVLYTQRICKGDIKRIRSHTLEEYRTAEGDYIQLIALNVQPVYQDRGYGFELLEFVLQYVSLHPGIQGIYAITRCRDFLSSKCDTIQEYLKSIYRDGKFHDPILNFHQSHGAKVLGLINQYRPLDTENQGYGVLIEYDINKRPWRERHNVSSVDNEKGGSGTLLLAYLADRCDIGQPDMQKNLKELGFDSLDFSELLVFVNETLGVDISMRELSNKSLEGLYRLCEGSAHEQTVSEEMKPLKRRIRGLMRKYPEIVPLHLEGQGPCTFWIHPLSGDVGIYNELANQADGSFQMIAIKARGFLSSQNQPLKSVIEMAKYYCEIITAIDPDGPYHLAGFSFGGSISYEMAYQLQMQGHKVATLALVEAPFISGREAHLFQTGVRNNLLMNANFLLMALLSMEQPSILEGGEKTGIWNKLSITADEVKDIPDEELPSKLSLLCRQKGIRQSADDLEYKLRSMADVHWCNLAAIHDYQAKKIPYPDNITCRLYRTKTANAVSDTIWNPDYLENIQREKGSLLPLMRDWSEVFPRIHTILLDGNNHFDALHSRESVKKFYNDCKKFYSEYMNKTEELYSPVAVVGMAGRFPDAKNIREYWDNLQSGHNSIRKVPDDRGFDIEDYYDETPKLHGKTYAKWGGFLSGIDEFDPMFFKISPRDAQMMDPSERLFIQESWRAIEDAGYNPKDLAGRRWGVFSCAKGDYPLAIHKEDENYYMPTDSYSAARLSYLLNFKGPAMAIDTACSSTSTVIAQACNSLMLGECDAAIAGGGAVYATPNILIGSSQSLLLSPDGCCYAFDRRANGTVVAEAVGAVVLKKLAHAVADGDHIYGVIRGWGLNQDGKTNGITAPSGKAQSSLQSEVYERFHINPENITMVEAHGTGTSLGDVIEYQALTDSFRKYTAESGYCALGSVKTNIGHAFFGSGIAGIIKVLLSVKNGKIPPSLNYESPREQLDVKSSPFYINTSLKEWKTEHSKPRCAAMNSFGATGTNVHLVIEEHKEITEQSAHVSGSPVIIILSAMKEDILKNYAIQCMEALERQLYKNEELDRIAYTLQCGREAMKERLGFVVNNIEELTERLEEYITGENGNGEVYSNATYLENEVNTGKYSYDVSNAMNEWKANKNADRLLELWVQGANIDWKELYQQDKPVRISLPAYPFAKERCWISPMESESRPVWKNRADNMIKPEKEGAYELLEFKEEWQETAFSGEKVHDVKATVCFLSEDSNQSIMRDFLKRNYPEKTIIFISQGKEFKKVDSEHYAIVKDKKQTYERAFHSILADVDEISTIAYLWAYEDAECIREYENIVYILQAISSEKVIADQLLLGASYKEGLEKCYLESWIGFERSIGPMMSKTRVKVILQDKKTLEHICKEMGVPAGTQSVLYEEGKRYEKVIYENMRHRRKTVAGSALKSGGTYLITGGMGKLGLIFSRYLAKEYSANLILSGRSGLRDEDYKIIEKIEQYGSQVFYIQSDICDKYGMKKGIEEAKKRFGTIQGVIHAAGRAAHQSIYQKNIESFEEILEPKIRGTLVLKELFDGIPLDFICYFSSAAAILGDFGACDYAVGNRFQMAYAAFRNGSSNSGTRRTVVINWPVWKDGGMKLEEEDQEMYLKSSGQRSLETKEGLEVFERVLKQGQTQQLVLVGERNRLYQFLHIKKKNSMKSSLPVQEGKHQGDELAVLLERDMKKLISQLHHIPVEKIEVKEEFVTYGFDSINIFEFARMISDTIGIDITPASLLGYSTLKKLIEYLTDTKREQLMSYYMNESRSPQAGAEIKHPDVISESDDMTEPIAVIGMSGRFPQADSVGELWSKLEEQSECITEIPPDRWDWRDFTSGAHMEPGKSNSRWGGFLRDIHSFDPLFFKISPREAYLMDPCQRIFLEESWHALEDAGYMGDKIRGKSCGVYVGIEEGEYGHMVRQKGEFYSNQNAMLSARIAYALDMKGPNLSVTASCSSGLVALHQACQALRLGECEIALAGGINLFVSPETYIGMSMLDLLSPTGKTYVFDQRADGMVPGEAVAAVILKPLSKAIRDKDHIYGCIKGSGVNNNGRGHGMMTPNPLRQGELIKNVLDKYRINPTDIQYVISHSVGTKLGDSAEIESLSSTFGQYSDQRQYCRIGSVKPVVGHTFAASGIVSLIAMLHAMKNGKILGVHNYEHSNENIDFDKTPFVISKENHPWISVEGKARTGVISTSGNSGTNAFAVIEEYKEETANEVTGDLTRQKQIFVFSAIDDGQLRKVVEKMIEYIRQNGTLSIADIAYTLQTGREPLGSRLAIIADCQDQLLQTMSDYLYSSETEKKGFYIAHGSDNTYSKTALQELTGEYDLELIAAHWVEGEDMVWDDLYKGKEKGRIVSLPCYPFKKEAYWISSLNTEGKQEGMIKDEKGERADVKNYILSFFSEKLYMQKGQINMNKPIWDYGVESILMMRFIREFEERFQYRISSRDMLNHPTLQSLSEYLADKLEEQQSLPEETYQNEAVIKVVEKYIRGDLTLEHTQQIIGEII